MASILLKRLFFYRILQEIVVNTKKYVMFLVNLIFFYQTILEFRNTKNGEWRKIKQTSQIF